MKKVPNLAIIVCALLETPLLLMFYAMVWSEFFGENWGEAAGYAVALFGLPFLLLSVGCFSLTIWEFYLAGEQWKKMRKTVIAVGVIYAVIPLMIIGGFFALATVESVYFHAYYEPNIKNIKISDVRDEILISPTGNPMGIQIKFDAVFPSSDEYPMYLFLEDSEDNRLSPSYGPPHVSRLPQKNIY